MLTGPALVSIETSTHARLLRGIKLLKDLRFLIYKTERCSDLLKTHAFNSYPFTTARLTLIPSDYTFGGLLTSKHRCFRVTQPDSKAPFEDVHGFTASDPLCKRPTGRPESCKVILALRDIHCASYAQLCGTISSVVSGGWGQSVPVSFWISSSGDLLWIIWEVARRLRVLRPLYVDVWIIQDDLLDISSAKNLKDSSDGASLKAIELLRQAQSTILLFSS